MGIYEQLGLSDQPAWHINYFCEDSAIIGGIHRRHVLASISLFKLHLNHGCIGKPIQVYYEDVFEDDGIYSLIPVQFIQSRSASLITKLDGESILFTLP